MRSDRRPSIFRIGQVRDDGVTVTITGWGLGQCAAACVCHRHPTGGHLSIARDHGTGDLGLVSYRPGCGCCSPWTAEELQAVLRDLAELGDLSSA